jgi:hypothetical protein
MGKQIKADFGRCAWNVLVEGPVAGAAAVWAEHVSRCCFRASDALLCPGFERKGGAGVL